MPPLSPELTRRVLRYLDVAAAAPDLALLDRLLLQYARTVPWESISRIAKRARTPETDVAARWSEEFWDDALRYGTGGTCFESNRAFGELLAALGFDTYLTVNDMGATVGCHTAVIVRYRGQTWLADAGYPVHAALLLDPQQTTERETPALSFRARPLGNRRYEISNTPHPRPYMFDLIDRPIDDPAYRTATLADYGPDGLFLDRLIVRKMLGDDIWRFNSAMQPCVIEQFRRDTRIEHPIRADVAAEVGRVFGIAPALITEALEGIERKDAKTQRNL